MRGDHQRDQKDRRRYPRFRPNGLMAEIGGHLVKVIDVSASGIAVENRFPTPGGPLPMTLYPSDGKRLDLNRAVRATGIVVRQTDTLIGIRFEPASLAVAKLVGEIIG